jgi:hypothetical protein
MTPLGRVRDPMTNVSVADDPGFLALLDPRRLHGVRWGPLDARTVVEAFAFADAEPHAPPLAYRS